jgi:hypothetical protein
MHNNSPYHRASATPGLTRRDFLWQTGGGIGGVALATMFASEATAAQTAGGTKHPSLVYPQKAKRVIQLFMGGAASHLDLWDFKPDLVKYDGKKSEFGEPVEAFQNGLGPWLKPVWEFKPHGQCGKLLGETVAPLGACVDDIAFVHNMIGKSGVHSQATLLQSTGFQLPGFPGAGCWAGYALGSMNENLPTFVVLPDHRGLASNGVKNWDAAFLPSQHSGTVIYPGTEAPISDLFPNKAARYVTAQSETDAQALMASLNRGHAAAHENDPRLDARIRSYELAAKMQLSAPEALDLKKEPEHILKLYGLDKGPQTWPKEINADEEAFYFSQKCLAARRLLERGVRFVQIWSGNDNGFPRRNWDSHEDIQRDHGPLSNGMARGTAALIQDLKQRGMLEDTLILWTTEFGRMPSSQGGKGRDHNPFVFTNWLAGGGIKGGITVGESDQWGYKPLDRKNPTEVYDIHATMLKLLGIEHTKLTWRHNGIDRRLTDVHGQVIDKLIG